MAEPRREAAWPEGAGTKAAPAEASADEPADPSPETEGLRERKKRRRRDDLHEVALRLVERQGLAATTVEQICEEVGVSPRTFFNYFPSKTAAALNLPEQIISPEAAERFRRAEGDLMPALCELIASSLNSGMERKRLKQLVADQPELMEAFTQWMAALKAEFRQLVEERAGSPEIASGAIVLVIGSLRMLMHDEGEDNRPDALRLLGTVDRLIAVRHAPMVAVTKVSAASEGRGLR